MSLDGYKKEPIKKLGGLVTDFPTETAPNGISTDCRNVRFGLDSVGARYGVQPAIFTGKKKAVNSMGMLVRSGQNPSQIPLLFNADGSLCFELSKQVGALAGGLGNTRDIAPTQFAWAPNTYLQMAAIFQRMYMANGDLKTGSGTPGVTDGTNVDPLSQRPFGDFWAANTTYVPGEMISPNPVNGHLYKCIVGGTSGNVQPNNFPVADSGQIAEGPTIPPLKWQEYTLVGTNVIPPPVLTVIRVPGAGAIPAARDVYIMITYVNGSGETVGSSIFSFVNTVLNDRFQIQAVGQPAWTTALLAPFAITGFNAYEVDVPTGNAAPILSAFKKANGGVLGLAGVTNIDAAAAGVAPPAVNTARCVQPGHVAAGLRYAAIIFVNRFQNLSGFTLQSVQPINVDINLFALYMANIPTGPANVVQRIVVLGAALTSPAGPFFYIDTDQGNANNTIFVINDNLTTAAVLNFTDDSLGGATDATNNLRKIKLPPQADVQYLPSLRRLVFCGEAGQPSLARFSNPDDPEGFYGDTGFKYISRDDGQRLVTHREYLQGVVIAFKEEDAYQLTTDNTDPLNWPAPRLWAGSAPCGPNAVDVKEDMVCYAHKSGAYMWNGSGVPTWITMEIKKLWDEINWDFGHLVCCAIDIEAKEVHFYVPFGESTVNNVDFCVNYARGWEPPVHFSSFSQKEAALPVSRKWTIHDIKAAMAFRAKRRVVLGDGTVMKTCFLIASPDALDSGVLMVQPETWSDGGKPFNSYYETATLGDGEAIFKFGGAELAAKGQGLMRVSGLRYHGKDVDLAPLNLAMDDDKYYTVKAQGQKSRQWGIRVGNGNQMDVQWELFAASIFMAPEFGGESSYVAP